MYADSSAFLIISVAGISLIAVFAILNACSWRRQAARHKQLWQKTAEETKNVNERVTTLATDNARLGNKITSWQNTWNFAADYIAQGGAVLALTTIRKQPTHQATSQEEDEPHKGSKENIFLPIPAKKPATESLHQIPHVPVVVLISRKDDTANNSFRLVVLQLQDSNPQIALQICWRPVFIADIEVTIDRNCGRPAEKQYQLDIKTVEGIDRGANSLAMDHLLARAQKEGAQKIAGQLTRSIFYETHRARLYYFYIEKYGFAYDAGSNIISKTLPAQDNGDMV